MIRPEDVLKLHEETVARWHNEPISNPYEAELQLVCQQHTFNFQLWHEEDIARSRDVSDAEIAQVKRNIDGFNQQRNDHIEKLDDWITGWMLAEGYEANNDAPINSETPGSIIDRLSILSLRIYHLIEQTERTDVEPTTSPACSAKSKRVTNSEQILPPPWSTAERCSSRTEAAQNVSPVQNVQRPNIESVPCTPRR